MVDTEHLDPVVPHRTQLVHRGPAELEVDPAFRVPQGERRRLEQVEPVLRGQADDLMRGPGVPVIDEQLGHPGRMVDEDGTGRTRP